MSFQCEHIHPLTGVGCSKPATIEYKAHDMEDDSTYNTYTCDDHFPDDTMGLDWEEQPIAKEDKRQKSLYDMFFESVATPARQMDEMLMYETLLMCPFDNMPILDRRMAYSHNGKVYHSRSCAEDMAVSEDVTCVNCGSLIEEDNQSSYDCMKGRC